MKAIFGVIAAIYLSTTCNAQTPAEAAKQRETYKAPLKAAYERQAAKAGTDCEEESKSGQQPYNICMGEASVQAEKDFEIFYKNLQLLCHDSGELAALQNAHKAWLTYEDSAMQAAHVAWGEGTGAPGFASQVYLSLLRDHMRQLKEIYGLNISQ